MANMKYPSFLAITSLIAFAVVNLYGSKGVNIPLHMDLQSDDSTNLTLSMSFSFYKNFISPIDGSRCQMRPSCSNYAHQSLKQYGLTWGSLMAADRIIRCGLSTHQYPEIWIDRKVYFVDNPEDNYINIIR